VLRSNDPAIVFTDSEFLASPNYEAASALWMSIVRIASFSFYCDLRPPTESELLVGGCRELQLSHWFLDA
jgi:hypothetical protein